jgi:hypothetical protein
MVIKQEKYQSPTSISLSIVATPWPPTAATIVYIVYHAKTPTYIARYLFEGKRNWEIYCMPMIPGPLAKIAFAANAALGNIVGNKSVCLCLCIE